MDETHIATAYDPHIAILDMNWSVILGEEFLIVFSIGFLALVLEWRSNIVSDHSISGGIVRHNAINVVSFECLGPAIKESADLSLIVFCGRCVETLRSLIPYARKS
jgi:hypothetical protein